MEDVDYTVSSQEWKLVHEVTSQVDRKHFWHVARNEKILSAVKLVAPDFSNIGFLEIGSGVGNVCAYLKDAGLARVEGWEINPDALQIARKRFPNVPFENNNFIDIPIGDQFSCVGFFDCLEHVKNDVDCLISIASQLPREGYLIITVPAHQKLWSWHDSIFGHFRRYSKQELVRKVETAGLKVVHTQYFMALLAPILLLRKIGAGKQVPSFAEVDRRYRAESGVSNSVANWLALLALRIEASLFKNHDSGFGASLLLIAQKKE
ncbi:MAG: class I SAM-dependent methyltransferase [Candidatus Melainabacteria bacterium]|nr:class I SAM-dependent methyltransferase [Candidatus Melainabacteria bacterium]